MCVCACRVPLDDLHSCVCVCVCVCVGAGLVGGGGARPFAPALAVLLPSTRGRPRPLQRAVGVVPERRPGAPDGGGARVGVRRGHDPNGSFTDATRGRPPRTRLPPPAPPPGDVTRGRPGGHLPRRPQRLQVPRLERAAAHLGGGARRDWPLPRSQRHRGRLDPLRAGRACWALRRAVGSLRAPPRLIHAIG
jgi:hypothetical protein